MEPQGIWQETQVEDRYENLLLWNAAGREDHLQRRFERRISEQIGTIIPVQKLKSQALTIY